MPADKPAVDNVDLSQENGLPKNPLASVSTTNDLFSYSEMHRKRLAEETKKLMLSMMEESPTEAVSDFLRANYLVDGKSKSAKKNEQQLESYETMGAYSPETREKIGKKIVQFTTFSHGKKENPKPLVANALAAAGGQFMQGDMRIELAERIKHKGQKVYIELSPVTAQFYQKIDGKIVGVSIALYYFITKKPGMPEKLEMLDEKGQMKTISIVKIAGQEMYEKMEKKIKEINTRFAQQFPVNISEQSDYEQGLSFVIKKIEEQAYQELGVKPLLAVGKTFTLDEGYDYENNKQTLVYELTDLRIGSSTKELSVDEKFLLQNKDAKLPQESFKEALERKNFRDTYPKSAQESNQPDAISSPTKLSQVFFKIFVKLIATVLSNMFNILLDKPSLSTQDKTSNNTGKTYARSNLLTRLPDRLTVGGKANKENTPKAIHNSLLQRPVTKEDATKRNDSKKVLSTTQTASNKNTSMPVTPPQQQANKLTNQGSTTNKVKKVKKGKKKVERKSEVSQGGAEDLSSIVLTASDKSPPISVTKDLSSPKKQVPKKESAAGNKSKATQPVPDLLTQVCKQGETLRKSPKKVNTGTEFFRETKTPKEEERVVTQPKNPDFKRVITRSL